MGLDSRIYCGVRKNISEAQNIPAAGRRFILPLCCKRPKTILLPVNFRGQDCVRPVCGTGVLSDNIREQDCIQLISGAGLLPAGHRYAVRLYPAGQPSPLPSSRGVMEFTADFSVISSKNLTLPASESTPITRARPSLWRITTEMVSDEVLALPRIFRLLSSASPWETAKSFARSFADSALTGFPLPVSYTHLDVYKRQL